MKKLTVFLGITLLMFTVSGNAGATLWDRGGGLIYDDVLNITWLQDANYGAGSSYDDHFSPTDGRMTWDNAVAWADHLVYGGYSDWRLPDAHNQDGSGPQYGGPATGSELGYMYYNNLGGTYNSPVYISPVFIDGNGESVSFLNMQAYSYYWFGTDYSQTDAWLYQLNAGYQLTNRKIDGYFAWAVRDGDVSPVPEPTTMLLLGSGLISLAGFRKKFRKR